MMGIFFALFGGFIIIFLLYLRSSGSKFNKDNPFISGLWFLYWIRWEFCILKIWIFQRSLPKRINNYDHGRLSYDNCGVVPTPSEVEIESPKLLLTDRHEDGIFIWGGDDRGKMVAAKVVRLSRRRACVSFIIQDDKGQIYTLPNQPDSNFINFANEHSWVGGGLFLECVEPMRTWRLKFNGILRCNARENYITDADSDDEDEGATSGIIHAKVDLLWKALKAPVDVWRDHSPSLLADALTREGNCDISLMRSLERDGYDQWGALHGTVQFENATIQTWYLRGIRQHRWGMGDSAKNLIRSVNLFSYFSNGDFLWIEGFSYRHIITHCVMGYVMTACGSYHPITWTDLEMSRIQEEESPKNIFVQVKAGGKLYNVWHHLRKGITVHTGDPWSLKHHIAPSYTAATNREGWGVVMLTQRYKGLCPVPEKRMFPVLSLPQETLSANYALQFSDRDSLDSGLTGGKGASLSFLTHLCGNEIEHEFIVPKGVIVTSVAWKRQQEDNSELTSAMVGLEKAVTSAISNKIKEACERIVSVIEELPLNQDIVSALKKALEEAFPRSFATKRFAVRSSACGEDSEEASSAGQNATFLGILWKDKPERDRDVLKALLSCWASQFSYQSVEYRRQRGQPLNEGMAVVIQEMVPADLAGVIFTRDPVTGNPECITIACNYGLGESVVSSLSEPDTFIVKRSWRNKLKIDKKSVGEKKFKTVMKESGGTSEVPVSSSDKSSLCMEDKLALRLSALAILVEEAFGSPRDIEFAVKSGVIYLLQSRPITSIHEWTDYEIMHEMDAAVPSDKEVYTIHNAGEVFPGCTTPLTISVVAKLLDLAIQKDFCKRLWPSYKFDPSSQRAMVTFCSSCFLNLGEVYYRTAAEEKISIVMNVVDLSIGGYLFTTEEIHKWVVSRYGLLSSFRKLFRIGFSIYEMLPTKRKMRKLSSAFSSYNIGNERANSAKALYKELCRRMLDLFQISENHVLMSSASSMSQCTALIILTENKEKINDQMIQDMASLLSCFGQTESGDVPMALKSLATALSCADELEEFLSMTPDEGKVWMESHPGAVGKSFASFIEKHGHRCYKEFDLETSSWGLAPETLVEVLQKMAPIASSFERKKERSLEEAIKGIKTPIKDSTKKALKFILKICGNAVRNREATKSLLIRTVDAFRKAYRTLGRLMVSECRLPDDDLIFYLHHREIETLLETRSATLILKAIKRRRLKKASDRLTARFPEISFGQPTPLTPDDFADIASEGDNQVEQLTGTPVCLGVAKGTARVVRHLKEASNIKKDDILVTYSTDVGWTPYFPLLSGIITEIGGLISHGAVVAREYGLPCVVGVKEATKLLTSGEEILLDGKAGIITKVTKLSPEAKT